jgi:hypothetical protein
MATAQQLNRRTRVTSMGTDGGNRSVSPRVAARIAGIAYVIMFLLAIFANFVVLEGLIEPDNGAATMSNIQGSMGMFRLGLISFLIVFILDVVVAWALNVVLRSVSHDLSLAAAWFRLVYSAFLGVGLVFLYQAMQLVGDTGALLGGDQAGAETMIALKSFDHIWLVGLTAFGVHLVLIGYLLNRSGYVSTALGYVLMAAGFAYGLDTFATTLLSNYADYEGLFQVVVAVPSMIGEGWLGLWLLLSRRLQS